MTAHPIHPRFDGIQLEAECPGPPVPLRNSSLLIATHYWIFLLFFQQKKKKRILLSKQI